jgi:tetratricopeptide (TPR) repeat protein
MEIKIEKLYNQAIDAALAKDWTTAIALHKEILSIDPQYLDSLLALAFAYMQTGDLKAARATYRAALDIDPVNVIAQNNIEKISILLKRGNTVYDEEDDVVVSSDTFMHTEGKTRVVTLSNIGQADVLAMLKIGERVLLKSKKRRVEVRNKKGEYVGCLPDDISKRLAFFLEAKSEFETIIKAATKNNVDVFIKEKVKGPKVASYISFPENIQDDLKSIMNKDFDETDTSEDEDGEETPEDVLEEPTEVYEDLEELARETDDEGEYLLSLEQEEEDEDELEDDSEENE